MTLVDPIKSKFEFILICPVVEEGDTRGAYGIVK